MIPPGPGSGARLGTPSSQRTNGRWTSVAVSPSAASPWLHAPGPWRLAGTAAEAPGALAAATRHAAVAAHKTSRFFAVLSMPHPRAVGRAGGPYPGGCSICASSFRVVLQLRSVTFWYSGRITNLEIRLLDAFASSRER